MGKYNKKTKLRSVKRERSTRRNPKKRPVYGERKVIAEAVAEEKEGTIVTPPIMN